MSGDPLLVARGLCKRWPDGRVALDGASIHIAERETVAIVGANGCGKSTLLAAIAGIQPVDAGELRFRGQAVPIVGDGARAAVGREEVLRAHRIRVGIVFQQFHLFPHLSVGANCMMGPRFGLRLDAATAQARASEALARVGLVGFFDRPATELSGGQQQRVAIARALANAPEAMLFDEPTSALDPQRTREVGALVRSLAAEHRMSMAVVTHDLDLVRDIADRVVLLVEGRDALGLSREEFFNSPDPRVRAYLSRG